MMLIILQLNRRHFRDHSIIFNHNHEGPIGVNIMSVMQGFSCSAAILIAFVALVLILKLAKVTSKGNRCRHFAACRPILPPIASTRIYIYVQSGIKLLQVTCYPWPQVLCLISTLLSRAVRTLHRLSRLFRTASRQS